MSLDLSTNLPKNNEKQPIPMPVEISIGLGAAALSNMIGTRMKHKGVAKLLGFWGSRFLLRSLYGNVIQAQGSQPKLTQLTKAMWH